jgi:hypothetical protein
MASTSCGCGLSLHSSTSVVAPQKIGQQKCMASSQSAILKFPAASMSLKGLGVGKLEISRARRAGVVRTGARRPISAVAAPIAPPSSPLEDAGERQRLAEEYGFTQIGEPVPEEVTLKKVIDSMPPEVSKLRRLVVAENLIRCFIVVVSVTNF